MNNRKGADDEWPAWPGPGTTSRGRSVEGPWRDASAMFEGAGRTSDDLRCRLTPGRIILVLGIAAAISFGVEVLFAMALLFSLPPTIDPDRVAPLRIAIYDARDDLNRISGVPGVISSDPAEVDLCSEDSGDVFPPVVRRSFHLAARGNQARAVVDLERQLRASGWEPADPAPYSDRRLTRVIGSAEASADIYTWAGDVCVEVVLGDEPVCE